MHALRPQVINLRTLKPLDRDTIVKSVRKTHRLVTAEEGWPQSGVGAELVALVNEEVCGPRVADRSPSRSCRQVRGCWLPCRLCFHVMPVMGCWLLCRFCFRAVALREVLWLPHPL